MCRNPLRTTVLTVAFLLLGLGAAVAPPAVVAGGGPSEGAPDAALRSILDEAVRQGSPGALAQSREYGRIQNLSAGVTALRSAQPPQAPMRFRIGSATKTFVATTVLQLVAERRIGLDDKVEDLLPNVFAGARSGTAPITVRMLLNHTSGLYDYTQDPRIEQTVVADPAHCFTPRALVDAGMNHPASFPPGTSWAYSNTNYTALALVIEKVTGRSYGEETTRRILRPLGLNDTSFPGCSPLLPSPRLHGYTKQDPHLPQTGDVTQYNPSFAAGNGDMISTVGDLNRFEAALLGGRLLPDRLLDLMLTPTPGSFPGTRTLRYGLGVVIVTASCGVAVYGHAGSVQGYQSWMGATRDGQRSMSFVLNNDWLEPTQVVTGAVDAQYCAAGPSPGRGRTTQRTTP